MKQMPTTCELDTRLLSCDDDTHLAINTLFYGRSDNTTCLRPDKNIATLNCPTPNGAIDVARRVCEGRTECYVEAISDIWGDNCPSTYKYLKVNYSCQGEKDIHVQFDLM